MFYRLCLRRIAIAIGVKSNTVFVLLPIMRRQIFALAGAPCPFSSQIFFGSLRDSMEEYPFQEQAASHDEGKGVRGLTQSELDELVRRAEEVISHFFFGGGASSLPPARRRPSHLWHTTAHRVDAARPLPANRGREACTTAGDVQNLQFRPASP